MERPCAGSFSTIRNDNRWPFFPIVIARADYIASDAKKATLGMPNPAGVDAPAFRSPANTARFDRGNEQDAHEHRKAKA